MRRGIGSPNAELERPELCNHYELAKRSFDGIIGFCSECGDTRCPINRYECQRFAATAELINACRSFPRQRCTYFNFHDFFKPAEIEKFLQVFTVPERPLNAQNAKECSLYFIICDIAS